MVVIIVLEKMQRMRQVPNALALVTNQNPVSAGSKLFSLSCAQCCIIISLLFRML